MIAQFALRLMFGMSLMWSLMPRREVSAGFFRIQMLIAMGLGVLAALTFGELSQVPDATPLLAASYGTPLCAVLAAAAFLGSGFWTLGRRGVGTGFVFVILALSGVLLIGSASTGWETARGWLFPAAEVATAATLGGAMTGMLLGHWYLTAPTMSIQPLSSLNRLFAIALGLRLVVSTVALVDGYAMLHGGTHILWLCLRWLAGILGPLVLVAMVSRILRYKNTQSATGVLFVEVILTFIGELSATLLARELHWPF